MKFIKEYCDQAFQFIEKNHLKDPNPWENKINHNILFEQILFAALAKDKGKKVTTVLDHSIGDNKYSYAEFCDFYQYDNVDLMHIIGGHKRNHRVCELLERMLLKKYPEFYNKIITLFKNNHKRMNPHYVPDNSLQDYLTFIEEISQKWDNISNTELLELEKMSTQYFKFIRDKERKKLKYKLKANPHLEIYENSQKWSNEMKTIIKSKINNDFKAEHFDIACIPSLLNKGYKEILIDGAQKVIRIKGNATSKAMRSMKTRTNSGTLSEIFSSMALDAKLTSAFDKTYASLVLDDMPQIAESDISYLTRIAKKTGAMTKPAAGHLIFADSMRAKSISGKNLPTKYIDAADVVNYTCAFRETETTTEGGTSGTIFANWYDKETGEYHLISNGTGEPETEEIFADEQSARAAITSQAKTKNNTTLRFSTAGRPDLFAESPLVLCGFPDKIPTNWIISNVQHSFNARGFTTSVECNIRS